VASSSSPSTLGKFSLSSYFAVATHATKKQVILKNGWPFGPLGFALLLLMVSFNSSTGCFHHAIGVQDPSIIPDNQMTASSYFSSSYYAHFGRLHDIRGLGWAGRTSRNPSDWLQVDFGRIALVCAVATQGNPSLNEWVIDFSLSFSSDGASWMYSNDSQGNKMASLYLLIFFCWHGMIIIIISNTIELPSAK